MESDFYPGLSECFDRRAEEWLERNAKQAAAAPAPAAIDPAVVRAQAAKAAPNDAAEQERLFRQFMDWAKTQKR